MVKQLRDYQRQALSAMQQCESGRHAVVVPTGGGKTVIFTSYINENKGRALILSHRSELVRQPLKYLNCSYAIEQGKEHSDHTEKVTSATVQTMVRRLDKFSPNEYDVIIIDECHHSSADTYIKILDYFKPRVTFGFSATIRRADGKSLQGVFNDIIFERNILYMIKQGYLCNVECRRVYLDFDLSNVKTSNGDYNITQLDEAMKGTEQGVVEAYEQYARGQTIIFCESVRQATEITSLLGDIAFIVTGKTPKEEREQLIKDFHDKKYKVAVNCAVFTEGYDEPAIETVIMASPTKSQSKFIQCAGRGMRLYEGKEKMLLIDICGASSCGMMTAPSLIGIDIDKVPPERQKRIEGDLLELEEVVEELSDCPTAWIKNTKMVDLWGKANGIDTLSLNFFQLPDGRMVVSLPERKKIVLPPMDMTGNCNAREIKGISSELLQWGLKTYGEQWEYQRAINCARAELERNYGNVSMVWDLKKTKSWGKKEPTEAQMKMLNRKLKNEVPENLTRFEASQILNRLNCK